MDTNNCFKILQFWHLFWPFYFRCHFSLIISFEFQNIFHIFTIFGLEIYIQYNSNFEHVHFLVLRNFSKFLLLGKRNPNTQRVYRNHTFCLLLACWLVGFSFSLLSGLQPPSKLVAVAMVAIGASRNQNLESLVTFPKLGVAIARGWSQPLLLFFSSPHWSPIT